MASQHVGATRTTRTGRFGELEQHRGWLTGHCYRMLGSPFEAEDAVQETLRRAWEGLDGFEGRAALRTWLYRIATNVCLDMLRGRSRRARPMELGAPSTASTPLGPGLPEATWLEPIPDGRVVAGDDDPGRRAAVRDTLRLAVVAALQHLPPRQRAILILREVVGWRAAEVAELLDTTVAAVNSALQRARATIADVQPAATDTYRPEDEAQSQLLERYVDAFERYDLDALVDLLHEDAVQSMPPYELWLRGREEIRRWMAGPGAGCRDSRLVPRVANGSPAFAQYRPDGDGGHHPWGLQVLEIAGGDIVGITVFLDTDRLFPLFGLPEEPGA